jgi:hypothetical protein
MPQTQTTLEHFFTKLEPAQPKAKATQKEKKPIAEAHAKTP